jgi:hypothetical protein
MRKEWRILIFMELQWRVFRFIRKLVNWLVRKKVRLTSPILCRMNQCLDHCSVILFRNKQAYEQITGHIIRYYKKDEV